MANLPAPEEWTGDRVQRWLRQSAGLHRQLAPVCDALLTAACLAPGESVLDVGCGTGPTTYAAASVVGPSGQVCGLDLSADMLGAAEATRHPDPKQLAPIDWVKADAVTWEAPKGLYDAVISRFGVMFFSDPLTAFTNLAAAARPAGRLAVAVWQRRDNSELFSVPLHAALAVLRSRGISSTAAGVEIGDFVATDSEGPFSLHDPEAVHTLLSRAGWSDIAIEAHLLALPFAGGEPPATAAKAALDFGPTRLALSGMDHDVIQAAQTAIEDAFVDYTNQQGHVVLSGAFNIVTAARWKSDC